MSLNEIYIGHRYFFSCCGAGELPLSQTVVVVGFCDQRYHCFPVKISFGDDITNLAFAEELTPCELILI